MRIVAFAISFAPFFGQVSSVVYINVDLRTPPPFYPHVHILCKTDIDNAFAEISPLSPCSRHVPVNICHANADNREKVYLIPIAVVFINFNRIFNGIAPSRKKPIQSFFKFVKIGAITLGINKTIFIIYLLYVLEFKPFFTFEYSLTFDRDSYASLHLSVSPREFHFVFFLFHFSSNETLAHKILWG